MGEKKRETGCGEEVRQGGRGGREGGREGEREGREIVRLRNI